MRPADWPIPKECKILAINKDHHSSVSLISSSHILYYNQEERLSRVKEDCGMPVRCLEKVREITDKVNTVIFTGYDTDDKSNKVYLEYLNKIGISWDYWAAYTRPHHLSHAFRSFCASGFKDAVVVVWDGKGSEYKFYDGNIGWETTSIYYMYDRNMVDLLYKKIYLKDIGRTKPYQLIREYDEFVEGDWQYRGPYDRWGDHTQIELTDELDLGELYNSTAVNLGFGRDDCGKVMGLAPYGRSDIDLFDPSIRKTVDHPTILGGSMESFNRKAKIAYDIQQQVEQRGLDILRMAIARKFDLPNPHLNLVLTGGVSLNISANAFYRKNIIPNVEMYIDPLCGDEGTCIGSAQIYANGLITGLDASKGMKGNYIGGHLPTYDYFKTKWYDLFGKVGRGFKSSKVDVEKIVDLLIDGNIVALYQGKSEAGPRALGNRSLLFDPRIEDGRNIVNTIKKRELFRPLACSIMKEHLSEWFKLEIEEFFEDDFVENLLIKESPDMMYAFDALPGVKEKVPSVVHIDNTSRIQTVTKEQNDVYWELLNSFNKRVGVPLLLNTSFNLTGQPMVESIEDAMDVLFNSKIEYLYLPDISQLIQVSND